MGSLFDKFVPITLEYQQPNLQTNISVEVTDKKWYRVILPQYLNNPKDILKNRAPSNPVPATWF